MAIIPYGRQSISQSDIDAVVAVLRSEFLTQGPAVPAFEKLISTRCSVEYAVAVNSATSALHIACLALGVMEGDSVWTTSVTFVASANCAVFCGAIVDFVDIDPSTLNISVSCLAEKLWHAEKIGTLPKVVIPVHLSGRSCDMLEIHELSRLYGFKIIEDASHAIGGNYGGEPIGNCRYSDIAVFSFHPVKIVTTGEGGMALTNNPQYAQRMELLRSHGVTRDPSLMTEKNPAPWCYEQSELGYNYRMTDIQAALGISQIAKLNQFVARRRELAARYDALLSDLPLRLPLADRQNQSSWHLYIVRLYLSRIALSHREVFDRLRSANISVNLHYMPVYLQPYYRAFGFAPGYCPEAESYCAEAISLPLYPDLSEQDQDYVVAILRRVLL